MKGRKTGGRQKGTPNKTSAARAKRAAATGIMPADVILEAMRNHYALADHLVGASSEGGTR